MKSKYFEHIVVYLSVLVACVLIGAFARLIVISLGTDTFTANIVFWVSTAFCLIIYAVLAILMEGLFDRIFRKLFPKKDTSLSAETKPVSVENLIEIKAEQERIAEEKKRAKRDFAVQYTQKEFAPYLSSDDLARLSRYVEMYADQLPFHDIQPIRVKTLTSLDLFHFGWNIWKYLNVSKQDDIALFLKKVFAHNLNEIEPESIKSHLKDDPKKGRILVWERG